MFVSSAFLKNPQETLALLKQIVERGHELEPLMKMMNIRQGRKKISGWERFRGELMVEVYEGELELGSHEG